MERLHEFLPVEGQVKRDAVRRRHALFVRARVACMCVTTDLWMYCIKTKASAERERRTRRRVSCMPSRSGSIMSRDGGHISVYPCPFVPLETAMQYLHSCAVLQRRSCHPTMEAYSHARHDETHHSRRAVTPCEDAKEQRHLHHGFRLGWNPTRISRRR